MTHKPITTLEELDALDAADLLEGYRSTGLGDPEPGANHSRSFHHGWRMRAMDLGMIEIPAEHRRMTHEWVERNKRQRQ